jgi:hypothetical protein
MTLKADWTNAKTKWEKGGQPKLEAPLLAQMKKDGWDKGDFGKKLDAFDTAKSLTDKRSAWAAAQPVAEKYAAALRKAKSGTKDSTAGSALQTIVEVAEKIIKQGKVGIQDPKPSGRAERVQLLAMQNAAGGLRPKWLEVGAIDVKAYLVVDALVMQLEKDKEIGFHWTELQKACAVEVAKSMDAFEKTILTIDGKLQIMSETDRKTKIDEANAVLKHYRGIVEANVNRIVDDYWARALKRQVYLKEFKKECKVDVAMSSVAIAVSTVSIAMSFGAAAVSVAVIAKAVVDIALTLEKMDRSANAVYKSLAVNMDSIEKLYKQRLQAKKDGAGQKASKTGQAGKTAIASALGPISALLMTTTPRTLKEAKEYVGKLSECEIEAGKMQKQLAEFTSKFSSSPVGPDARQNSAMRVVHKNFMAMNKQYQGYAAQLAKDIEWGENCIKVCERLSDEDAIVIFTNKVGTGTKLVAALGSVAQVSFKVVATLL